jgi:hypothetical protein
MARRKTVQRRCAGHTNVASDAGLRLTGSGGCPRPCAEAASFDRRDAASMSAVERTAVLPEPREQRLPGAGMFAAGRRLVVGALFASLPALLVLIAAYPLQSKVYGWDLRAFYDAGHAFVQHRSPYPEASLSALASQNNFVYPLPVAAIFAPLSVLPFPLVFALFVALNTACIILTLRILGVRDRLCYAAALLALPAQYAIKLGTISPLLALGLALLWRYRDRRLVAAMTIAGLIVAKLFLWPRDLADRHAADQDDGRRRGGRSGGSLACAATERLRRLDLP